MIKSNKIDKIDEIGKTKKVGGIHIDKLGNLEGTE